MKSSRKYEKTKTINKILQDHFEEFKILKLKNLKNKEMREHIIKVVEKS